MKATPFKIVLLVFLITHFTFSQIGIGTTDPKSTLDITAVNATGSTTDVDGIIVPRVDRQRAQSMTTVPTSTLIYVNSIATGTATGIAINITSVGFYYYNGTVWVKLQGDTRTGTVASTATLVEPNVVVPGTSGPLTNAGTNTTGATFDNTTITRTIAVTGFTGNITNVTCNVQITHTWGMDIDLYLQSPTGQIIELNTDNGGTNATTFNVTFSDAGATNITTWLTGNVAGTYRPEGSLTADVIAPTITTMAGFNGNAANGTWTLHARDDLGADNFVFSSFSLSIATAAATTYRLIGETSITYKTGNNIVTNAMYSANSTDNEGFITALSRSTTSAGAIGTTAATVPGTILSYASDSPRQGSGNYWATTYNQSVSNGLVNGTTYYFQLWAKVNTDTPTTSNEIFSLIPMMLPQ